MIRDTGFSQYRWVMLIALMLLTAMIELQWLTHAAVARPASHFYSEQISRRSWLEIDNLALIFMVGHLLFAIPTSWFIARFGLKNGLRLGSILLGSFGLLKGLESDSLTIIFIAQMGLAVAQPLIVHAVTTLTDQWFPEQERAMAAGFAVFAQFIGILLVMVITPAMAVSDPTNGSYGKVFLLPL